MTSPIWFAIPPEVNSTLLSAGPGSGPVLAAAAALEGLAVQYATASDELLATLAASAASIWQGQSAEQFSAAHTPFLVWLTESAAAAAAAAAEHETVAGAYEAALAAMPTMAELIANHVAHALLTATNFLGINTIPLAVNEADYARMWLQAATVMSTYQAVSETSLAAMPQSTPAPAIMNPGLSATSRAAATPAQANAMSDATQARAHMDNSDNNSNHDLLSMLPFWDQTVKAFHDFMQNPSPSSLLALLAGLGSFAAYQAVFEPVGWGTWLSPIWAPLVALGGAATAIGVAVPLGAQALQQPQEIADGREEQPAPPMKRPVSPTAAPPVMPSPASTPAPSAMPPQASAPPPPSIPAPGASHAGSPAFGYAVEGEDPPGAQFGPTSTTGLSSPASSSSSASAAAVAASSAHESASSKRKQNMRGRGRQVKMEENQRMRADGYMDLEEPPVEPSASGLGAGLLGAERAQKVEASGFAKLPDGTFHTGPTVPMLPQTWAEASEDKS